MKKNDNPLDNNDLDQNKTTEVLESEMNVGTDEPTAEVSELDKIKAESADWKDKYVRLYAEFDNFRHRNAKEKLALIGTATEGLMVDLLTVLDDFERSQKAMEASKDVDSLKEGVSLVYHKLHKLMSQKGLKAMDCVGQKFDPDFHEAITQFPAASPEQKGQVIDEVEKGYMLNNKTIRFAKVVIGA